jgi:hypothetical protein
MKLELMFVRRTTKRIYFKIEKQYRRGFKGFKASNGILIESKEHPQWFRRDQILFTRGVDKSLDDDIMWCSHPEWKRIQEAVIEFNPSRKRGK